MPSLKVQIVTLVACLAVRAATQTINPDSVDIGTRETWCDFQKSACPLLCLQMPGATDQPEANDCTAVDLAFQCVCSNGLSPNASQYSQTIPYFLCTESNNQCVEKCGQNSACASACRSDHPCGAQDPIRVNLTSTTSTMAAAATATSDADPGVYTGYGGAAATSSSRVGQSGATALAVGLGQTYGLAVVVGGFFGGFALLL